MGAFKPSRADGRSDRRVIFEFTQHAEPDTLFGYDQLMAELQQGLDAPVTRDRVYRAVGAANRTLLREQKRYLSVVRDLGYRVIWASEHLSVALIRKGRAQSQIQRGVEMLQEVRADELDANQLKMHQGQLLILSHLHQAIGESERRHDRSEALIAELAERIDRLEGGSGPDAGDTA